MSGKRTPYSRCYRAWWNKIGRRNEYKAVVAESEYQAAQTQNFLDRVYGGNVRGLVSTLLQQDILSEEEMKEIEAFWKKKKGV